MPDWLAGHIQSRDMARNSQETRVPGPKSLILLAPHTPGPGMSYPEIIGDIERSETIARGSSVRNRHRLTEQYGEHRRGQWRKMKGWVGLV